MAFRGREMMKKIARKLGEKKMSPKVEECLKKNVPDSHIVMNRANRGLFAGKHIRFGNRVSEDGGNKSRRCWKPNIQSKRLFSYILDRHIKVKVSMHALRTIDKYGGIDEYLLKTPYKEMDTQIGIQWKATIEKLYEELGSMEVLFFSPEDEAKLADKFKKMNVAEQKARRKLLEVEKPKVKKQAAVVEEATEEVAVEEAPVLKDDKKLHPYPGRGAIIFNF